MIISQKARNSPLALAFTFFFPFGAACKSEDNCYQGNYKNVTSYAVKPNRYTDRGIGLDDPADGRYSLDADEIDWQVNDLEECLNDNFAVDSYVSDMEARDAGCVDVDFRGGIDIKRGCLVVKLPDDLYTSQCTGKMLFECSVDDQLCKDKGLEPKVDCPCNCRATVQDDNYIITEPGLEVFRGELARIVTTCNNPWLVHQISPCLDNPYK